MGRTRVQERLGANLASLGLASLAVSSPLSVVGFFQFSVRFNHDGTANFRIFEVFRWLRGLKNSSSRRSCKGNFGLPFTYRVA